jgi:hypothetical protein
MSRHTVKPGEIVFYAPLFAIPEEIPKLGMVIDDAVNDIEPYKLLVEGNLVTALRVEVARLGKDGI